MHVVPALYVGRKVIGCKAGRSEINKFHLTTRETFDDYVLGLDIAMDELQ